MTKHARNRIVAAVFAVLAVAIIAAGWQLPPGIGNLPGPGFFPTTLGFLMLLFAAMLAAEGWSTPSSLTESGEPDPGGVETMQTDATASTADGYSWALPLVVFVLMVGYIATWEVAPFLVRTPLLIVVVMRLSGASWRATALAAVLFPAVLYALFSLGLRVDLG